MLHGLLREPDEAGLLSIKIVFLGGEPLPVEPRLCQVVPLAVDINLEAARRNKIEFFGYDFDREQISVALATSGGETDVTAFLDQPTHYHLTLNLGSTGVQLPADATRSYRSTCPAPGTTCNASGSAARAYASSLNSRERASSPVTNSIGRGEIVSMSSNG